MNQNPLTCRDVIEFVMAYIDDELAAATRAEFDRHLHACVSCVNYLDSYRTTIQVGRQAMLDPNAPAQGQVPEQLIKAIQRARGG